MHPKDYKRVCSEFKQQAKLLLREVLPAMAELAPRAVLPTARMTSPNGHFALTLTIANTEQVAASVREGRADLGLVEGEVDTQDTSGVVQGAIERFPPSLFLRETPLTTFDPAIVEFARAAKAATDGEALNVLHALLKGLHEEIVYDTDPTNPATTAAEAFALKRGVCQDFTEVMIAGLRGLGLAAASPAPACAGRGLDAAVHWDDREVGDPFLVQEPLSQARIACGDAQELATFTQRNRHVGQVDQ